MKNNHLPPSQLNKTTYLEIFNSTKNSLKKNLNYINYTKHDHDVITNQRLSSAYTSFRSDLYKYKSDKPDLKEFSKRLFLNRSPPGSSTDKRHIKRNIRHIKNLSDLNKIRAIDSANYDFSYKSIGKNLAANGTHNRNKSSFVFFKRKADHGKSRRFNERDSQNLLAKVG